MSVFLKMLTERQPAGQQHRKWIFVPYDQLSDQIGPLRHAQPADIGIILIENRWKAARRPYHKQKLAFILSNMRHFALEQAARGCAVKYLFIDGPYRNALEELSREIGKIMTMQPAERELWQDIAPLVENGALVIVPHEGWLTTSEQFARSQKGKVTWRMDAFYRHVRQQTGILMQGSKPVGGKYSFDAENRKPWHRQPPAPQQPAFPVDAIKQEVGALVEQNFAHHPGKLDLVHLPATKDDAEVLWIWAQRECMPHFGPYEDAMSVHSTGLFHSRISALVNMHRLLPQRILDDALQLDIPLASKEGFARQILGWREFVRHIHDSTDGFRILPNGVEVELIARGDAGYAQWHGQKTITPASRDDADRWARPLFFNARNPLPPAFWGTPSGLTCLDQVVSDVWREAYSHHITRLMVLSNIATLLDVDPRALTDWFWVAYSDAFEWVVEPNVLGMGTFSAGEVMSTKPYISGAAYIKKMSDFCISCQFDPQKNCPITPLYWAFLARHRERLQNNPRMRLPLNSLSHRSVQKQAADEKTYQKVISVLMLGKKLRAA